MKLRVFEAFAGYGSQSIALELLAQAFPDFQFDTVGISEIDKNAIKAYRTLHGNIIPNHGDITKIDWTQTADFDLLTYSFPCQDISSAGKQRGFTEGCGFKTNFQTGEGISGTIKTREGLCSCDTFIKVPVYGNSRLNTMIADGKIDPEETLWIDCYNQRVDPDIAGTILARVNATGHYLISDPRGCAMRGRPDASGRNSQQIELGSDVANALTSVQKDSMVAEARVIQVGNLIEDSAYKNPHRGRVYSVEGIAPCLNCNEGGQREVKIIQRGHGYAKGGVFDICPALTTSKWQDNHFALIEYWIRKLTPRECFRLMDVPEHYIDRLLSTGISNSQLYKLAGNSIVVACLFHIFRKMFCETARESGSPIAHSRETPAQLSLF